MDALKIKISVLNLPAAYTCDGEDKSPQISIEGVNTEKAKSLAIIVIDPNSASGNFIHWIAWDMELVKLIPEKIPKDPVVTFPMKAVQGKNSFGKIGYSGPCPPKGQTHRYDFKVYSIDTLLNIPPDSSKEDLVKAMSGHVVQFGETFVTYGR